MKTTLQNLTIVSGFLIRDDSEKRSLLRLIAPQAYYRFDDEIDCGEPQIRELSSSEVLLHAFVVALRRAHSELLQSDGEQGKIDIVRDALAALEMHVEYDPSLPDPQFITSYPGMHAWPLHKRLAQTLMDVFEIKPTKIAPHLPVLIQEMGFEEVEWKPKTGNEPA